MRPIPEAPDGLPLREALRLPSVSVRMAVLGPTGFLGSHVVARAEVEDLEVTPVRGLRIPDAVEIVDDAGQVRAAAKAWQAAETEAFARLVARLEGCDVVVNAAGLAQPGSSRTHALFAANAVLPAVAAAAARAAGVRRLVHVSSAVVQGALDPLDESSRHFPPSPYARSKAVAEQYLLEDAGASPPEVVVHRPVSIQHHSRATTRNLARLLSLPVVPVVGPGTHPVPVQLVENVAAGIVFAATTPDPPRVALQPGEGMTAKALLELFGRDRKVVVRLPRATAGPVRRLAAWSRPSPRFTSLARRSEVLLLGQGIDARSLAAAGFVPPVGAEGWMELANRLRPSARALPQPSGGRR